MVKINLSTETITKKDNTIELILNFVEGDDEIDKSKNYNLLINSRLSIKLTDFLKKVNFKNSDLNNFFYSSDSFYFIQNINLNDLENIRRAGSKVFDFMKSNEFKKIIFNLDNLSNKLFKDREISVNDFIYAFLEGICLSDYDFFSKYKKDNKNNKKLEFEFSIQDTKTKIKNFKNILKELKSVSKAVKFTRDLVNENADIMTPSKLESLAMDFAKKHKLKINVLDEKKIKKTGLNLLYNVGKGAKNPPRLIIMEYIGNKSSKSKIALVGKGITFDTGGINLKPSGFLEDMKSDMGGAATVFGAFRAIVENKLKKNVICVISSAENAIDGASYKPGDIIKSYKGLYVEIGNTDAEGRLALADALSYVQDKYNPTHIIDMATLTGACLVALGPKLIAMMGNNKEMKKNIFDVGEKVYERVWELPIYEEHRKAIETKYADVCNISKGAFRRFGGAITAGAFLEKFIEKDINWTHLDIAGAARSLLKEYYIPEFGTGRGVRLIYSYIKEKY
jgi:leucyl aminopeptidase